MADNLDSDFFNLDEPHRHRSQTWGGNMGHSRHHQLGATGDYNDSMESIDTIDPSRSMPVGSFMANLNSAGPSQEFLMSPATSTASASPMSEGVSTAGDNTKAVVKKSSRKNPWGSDTYADMIVRAIESYVDGKATLQQIYDYISHNYSYFAERSGSAASAGWKNSIRHNLSLHNRFVKCPKSGDNAKSCNWMVNYGASKRTTIRRRAGSMDAGTKRDLETAKRAMLRKRNSNSQRNSLTATSSSDLVGGKVSPGPEESLVEDSRPDSIAAPARLDVEIQPQLPDYNSAAFTEGAFRDRSGSCLSNVSVASFDANLRSEPERREDKASRLEAMDGIVEEFCLELVRRVVLGEDEADLIVCADNLPGHPVKKTDPNGFYCPPSSRPESFLPPGQSPAYLRAFRKTPSPVDQSNSSLVSASWG